MQFFENDWITFTYEPIPGYPHQTRLNWKISENIIIPPNTKEELINAVKRMDLGSNPIVALSGGVDSQAACLILKSAGIDFTTVTMVFEDELNSVDVKHANLFCEKYDISNIKIDIHVTSFLRRNLYDYVVKYECPSPQLCTHFYLYEQIIKTMNPTCIIAGGNAPMIHNHILKFDVTRSQNAWTVFASKNNFKLYGNFLSYSFDIASALIISRPEVKTNFPEPALPADVYVTKCKSYQNLGFDVIPQESSNTGFEKVKLVFQELTDDGWAFEKMFRHPYQLMFDDFQGVVLQSPIVGKLAELNANFINNSDK
jgi:rhodanese-related sulfurtransferase